MEGKKLTKKLQIKNFVGLFRIQGFFIGNKYNIKIVIYYEGNLKDIVNEKIVIVKGRNNNSMKESIE